MDSGKMETKKEKVKCCITMEESIREIGRIIIKMGMVLYEVKN